MNELLLNDKNEYPDDNVLRRHLGKTKVIWDQFTSQVSALPGAMTMEWRYYNDGKSWLCKLVYKKKTMCWISIWDGFFKTTFYFMERNDKDIQALPIDKRWKESYLSHKGFGKLKPLTIEVKTKKALSNVLEVLKYKSNQGAKPRAVSA